MNSYGSADASYKAAGELGGISQLVDDFYTHMETIPEAYEIRQMHGDDLSVSRRKLSYFLSGWLGGPKLYAEHFGGINIPGFHQHLHIGEAERDAWLFCMQQAIDKQPYDTEFKSYLLAQLRIPAERIRLASERRKQQQE